VGSIPIL